MNGIPEVRKRELDRGAAVERIREYRLLDLNKRTAWLRRLLVGFLVYRSFSVMAEVVSLKTSSEADAGAPADGQGGGADLVYLVGHAFNAPILIAAAVFFFLWTYRANNNAHALGATEMMTPAWAIGGYFIPFLNLIFGMEAMSEIWKASRNPLDWKNEQFPIVISIWWIAWVIANSIAWYTATLSSALTVESRDQWDFVRYCFDLVAIVALIRIVGAVNRMAGARPGRPTLTR